MNIRRLNDMGKKDAEISRELGEGFAPSSIVLYKKLLAVGTDGKALFSPSALKMIHEGKITRSAAFALADLKTSAKIDAHIAKEMEAAKNGKGKAKKNKSVVSLESAKNAVRKKASEDEEEGSKAKRIARSYKETHEFVESYTVAGVPPIVKTTAKVFLEYMDGKRDEKYAEKVLMRLGEKEAA